MEDVLDVYERPYDPDRPVVCLDEASKQILCDIRAPVPMQPNEVDEQGKVQKAGQIERVDSEYSREGTANLFMMLEPLAGRRYVDITQRRTAIDFAHVIKDLVDVHYPEAQVIVLVMDNLNTHTKASLYEAFPAQEARRLSKKLEIHHTPKHGSWLNMAEIELSVLARQCLEERMQSKETLRREVAAWQEKRNHHACRVNWQFTTADARIKLKHLYPSFLP